MKEFQFIDDDVDKLQCLAIQLIGMNISFKYEVGDYYNKIIIHAEIIMKTTLKQLQQAYEINSLEQGEINSIII